MLKKNVKMINNNHHKTTGLYKIAANIIKKVKSGKSYKTQLYQAQYPNKLVLNAVLMNVFKWEKVIDILIEKSNILEKEEMDREFVCVLITELMWSKFGLKSNAKNILAVKKYKEEFKQIIKDNKLEQLTNSLPTKAWKPRYFRVNTLVTTLDAILKKLSDLKFKKLETPTTYAKFLDLIKSDKFKGNTFVQDFHIKELLVFNSKVKFYKLNEYNNGSLIVQDKASCLAAYLLNPEPGSTVLDMCAAPGMKTSYLAALMQNKGKLYAVDRCKDRFFILQNMLEKYSVNNVEAFNIDALNFPYFDDVKYILVDPSCSGTGIVDRVQNDTAEQDENFQTRLKKLANVHAQLLNHALRSFPNLERLVYSTCSSNHEENESVVDEALSINGKFKLLDATKILKGWTNKGTPGYDCSEMCINAVSNTDCTNGFFIAIFVRRDFEDDFEINEEKDTIEEYENKLNDDDFGIERKMDEEIHIKNKSLTEQNTNEMPFVKKSKSAKRKERQSKLDKQTSNIIKPMNGEKNTIKEYDDKINDNNFEIKKKTDEEIHIKNKSLTEQNTNEISFVKKSKSAKRNERRSKLEKQTLNMMKLTKRNKNTKEKYKNKLKDDNFEIKEETDEIHKKHKSLTEQNADDMPFVKKRKIAKQKDRQSKLDKQISNTIKPMNGEKNTIKEYDDNLNDDNFEIEEGTDEIHIKHKSLTEQNTDEMPFVKKRKIAKGNDRQSKLDKQISNIIKPIVSEKTIKKTAKKLKNLNDKYIKNQ